MQSVLKDFLQLSGVNLLKKKRLRACLLKYFKVGFITYIISNEHFNHYLDSAVFFSIIQKKIIINISLLILLNFSASIQFCFFIR